VGRRVIAIALAQLLFHSNHGSHLVNTADQSSGDSSYQQMFTLRTADQYSSRVGGSQNPEAHWNIGCAITRT